MEPFTIQQRSNLRTISAMYFIIWGAIGLFLPFVSLYYREVGLSGTQIGLINTVAPLMGAAGAALWGILSDRTGRTRILLAAASIGLISSILALSAARNYMTILAFAACLTFFQSPILILLDSTTLRTLGARASEYGRYRMWGTIGFVATNAIAGFALERTGIRAIFIAYPIGLLVFLAASRWLKDQSLFMNPAPFKGIGNMIRRPAWVFFALSTFILWFATTGSGGFLSLTIKEYQGGEGLVGLAFTVAAIAEIPFFLFSALILKRVGTVRLMILAFSGYTVRMLLLSMVRDPVWFPVIGLMQAITFCPFLIASVAYANEQAPDDLKATSQGLLATVTSIASMAGSFTAGRLFDTIGPAGMYRSLTGVAALALIVFLSSRLFMRRRLAT